MIEPEFYGNEERGGVDIVFIIHCDTCRWGRQQVWFAMVTDNDAPVALRLVEGT